MPNRYRFYLLDLLLLIICGPACVMLPLLRWKFTELTKVACIVLISLWMLLGWLWGVKTANILNLERTGERLRCLLLGWFSLPSVFGVIFGLAYSSDHMGRMLGLEHPRMEDGIMLVFWISILVCSCLTLWWGYKRVQQISLIEKLREADE